MTKDFEVSSGGTDGPTAIPCAARSAVGVLRDGVTPAVCEWLQLAEASGRLPEYWPIGRLGNLYLRAVDRRIIARAHEMGLARTARDARDLSYQEITPLGQTLQRYTECKRAAGLTSARDDTTKTSNLHVRE